MSYRGEQKIKGKTYVYEAIAHWDKVKKRSVQKRVYIGVKDGATGDFIPNKKYYELYGGGETAAAMRTLPTIIKAVDYGDVYLMRRIVEETGLMGVLEHVFPECYKELLVCAFHQITAKSAMSHCKQWAETASVFKGVKLSSQRISELLAVLDENRRMHFYRQWASLRQEREYLAFDITSVSS
jgi:hypothetical protein